MPKVTYTKAKGLFQESGSTEQMAILGSATAITAGTTQSQAGATATTAIISLVTCANANDGVILPSGVDGAIAVIHNISANALKVYPASGEIINGASANAAFTHAASKNGIYIYSGATKGWIPVISQ